MSSGSGRGENWAPGTLIVFTVAARVGKVAYRLDLPAELSQIPSTFHISQLRKYLVDDSAVMPPEDIQVDNKLDYIKRLIAILDWKSKNYKTKASS